MSGWVGHGGGPFTTTLADATHPIAATGPFAVVDGEEVAKVSALLDGLGGAPGVQDVRAIITSPLDGSVFSAVSEWVSIASGAGPVWADFLFDAPITIPDGVSSIYLAVATRTTGAVHYGVVRVYSTADTTGYLYPATLAFSITATFITPTLSYPFETDYYYARLPWPESQRALSATPPDGSIQPVRGFAGWYGTARDRERGANAIVDRNGPYADLVGERVRITRDRGALPASYVSVFVHAQGSIDEDIALTRRAFMSLATLSSERLPVRVEVLS